MEVEQLASKLVLWIREQVLAAECKGVVVGMSGGLDSSVLAVLCHRAFPQNMLGVIMPCCGSKQDEEHAMAVASQFSIPTKLVVLAPVFDALLQALPGDTAQPNVSRLAKANLKVRLRMLTLYYFANRLKYMVAGASNRSELAVGYFTKYGDGGVDILPLGNLVKGQVRELANFLGIPRSIIDKPPSAGLWQGQTDEGELGLSYDELDRYLVTGETSIGLRQKIESMITASAHKRLPPPVASLQ
ncbi:MAG: NAD(+) synthase [Dehalococcoidia bacterium]|nr:MAG: NAD(+) synthase [Dehalococcoidia bacterium]